MSKTNLEELTNAQLLERYTTQSLQQSDATYQEDGVAEYTRLYKSLDAISNVFRARGVEARKTLVPLLKHRNAQVRLNAAHELLAVVPDEARAVLEDLSKSGPGPQRLSAGMALMHLDNGVYKPT